MTDAPANGHAYLDFNTPLSDTKAYDLINSLAPLRDATVVDYGCGWAELLLRAVEHEPGATGLGVDSDRYAIDRGNANIRARGLGERVRLELADVTSWETPAADVAISIGSSHAWGGTRQTLEAMHARLKPGGRLLLGDGFWQSEPNARALEIFQRDEFGTLDELVDLAMACGYRLLNLATASMDEWDSFESRWCAGRERWLLDHPDHPEAAEVRAIVDDHRDGWLKGYRGSFGLAYLTLARR
ncbi:cyclopropane fatty-acyl-phospholipid synthase-like methyltransferase [Saccharothrix tamanrassetensis]|uniref:Cyclopropane fatty-acyl-phospholipid synthase-like methyltransferase n=1 Tax=Saccharothrix tamanrassetensis TaxID=1051531 RepID=A0A841CPB2_9PSEU|nr:class I SAM-dependent methyltransferase [Saccharothrix tamanrassetensis]MBB5959139.1 cyclopropane fatty-acyl-phospholipid synthase-like methyltransferase [Saccharothrix tamanrassetensis]